VAFDVCLTVYVVLASLILLLCILKGQSPGRMTDKYGLTEGFHGLAWAYAHVPDLHIMWLLYLCDAHQQNQSWAEAAQCAVAVAGVIMQVSNQVLTALPLCAYQYGATRSIYPILDPHYTPKLCTYGSNSRFCHQGARSSWGG
jgi:hypothetical protein